MKKIIAILLLIAATAFADKVLTPNDDGFQTEADKAKTGPLFIVGGCKKKAGGLTISNFRGTPSPKNPVGRYIPIGKQPPVEVKLFKDTPAPKREEQLEDGLPLSEWRKCIIQATKEEPNNIKKRLALYQQLRTEYLLKKGSQ